MNKLSAQVTLTDKCHTTRHSRTISAHTRTSNKICNWTMRQNAHDWKIPNWLGASHWMCFNCLLFHDSYARRSWKNLGSTTPALVRKMSKVCPTNIKFNKSADIGFNDIDRSNVRENISFDTKLAPLVKSSQTIDDTHAANLLQRSDGFRQQMENFWTLL